MASVLKAQKANAVKADLKGKGKRKADEMDVDEVAEVQIEKKKKNKQRVLLLSSRGVTHRMRHLMVDLEALLPHVKKGLCVLMFMWDVQSIKFFAQTRSSTRNHNSIYFPSLLI